MFYEGHEKKSEETAIGRGEEFVLSWRHPTRSWAKQQRTEWRGFYREDSDSDLGFGMQNDRVDRIESGRIGCSSSRGTRDVDVMTGAYVITALDDRSAVEAELKINQERSRNQPPGPPR
ncbi:hypothetical protein PGTUg99_012600 [Puccinia graminis f. sp. tritici]|uniref:Uncharacterized protein n=1 Tax=Puccinia graminis f. sp. tritici TaxID=56615 RepID=A0A5B0NWT0_PUCGR|nr:hypothetical protein PGTUg99_012600 [Puccinia graminis f. sp. tritici]